MHFTDATDLIYAERRGLGRNTVTVGCAASGHENNVPLCVLLVLQLRKDGKGVLSYSKSGQIIHSRDTVPAKAKAPLSIQPGS